MDERVINAMPGTFENLGPLGAEFESIAQKESPQEAVELLLSVLGKKYHCDRVYVFEKNRQGNYDCTDEWVHDPKQSKKHLLQNLSKNAVKQYYRHFARKGKLLVRDMEEFAKEDYPLYQMLRAQDLSALLVGQMVYDNQDRGFIGIDNPDVKFFDEIQVLFDFITYFVTLQKHRSCLERRITAVNRSMEDNAACRVSMYDRLTELKSHSALAVIYCTVAVQGGMMNSGSDVANRTIAYAEQMFGSMFGQTNVYNLGRDEFILIYEENKNRSLEEIDHYMRLAERSLEKLNAHLLKGVAAVSDYKEDFFDLVNLANAYMQNEKKRYKQQFTGKYHFDDEVFTFSDLVEIRPERDRYTILYSEYLNEIKTEDSLENFIDQTAKLFVENDQKRFQEFCRKRISNYRSDTAMMGEPCCEQFNLYDKSGSISRIEVVVLHYKDLAGESVLMCYTR